MKKPVVDYREFRFNRLNEPQFCHLKLLAGWIVYFALYFITENLIPAEVCHPVHCFLDDIIPFCEFFAVFYVFWYALIFGSLLYNMLYNIEKFSRLQTFIMVTQAIAMTAYILYPTRQDLRPEVFERNNILTQIMGGIYAFDTNTGVCPSLHVAYSLGVVSVTLKDKNAKWWWKSFIVVITILISFATAFVKQHSMLDVLYALPTGMAAELFTYRDRYFKSTRKGRSA